MALHNDGEYLTQSQDEVFGKNYSPGTQPPYSGIYWCMGCGREVVAEKERQLPPQNHHQHNTSQGSIQWRLIVFADHQEK
jgi:hypothetical protein